MAKFLDLLNYQIIPLFLIIFLTPCTQYLTLIGNPSPKFGLESITGNYFSWTVIILSFVWAIIWLRVPSKKFYGPLLSAERVHPVYQANGEFYYLTSILTFLLVSCVLNSTICIQIYDNMGPILGALNVVAIVICLYLLVNAKLKSTNVRNELPLIYEFYQGMKLNPTIFGVDVKQLTNCRIGMLAWQILILAFAINSFQNGTFGFGFMGNVLLQSYYIYMFFQWETGYFLTLDFIMDKTGWMLIFGCLVWIPSLYTFSSYFLVFNQPKLGLFWEMLILIFGIIMIYCHSEADRQKDRFKNANGKQIEIWGKPAKTLRVKYNDADGKEKVGQFLISGFWGIARKMNYTFDILSTLSWSLYSGFNFGIWPYSCWIFVTILLIHRVFRDEEKCKSKYGKGWDEYCSIVKYRLIPYVF